MIYLDDIKRQTEGKRMTAVKIMFIILMCAPILVLSVQLLSKLIDECLNNNQEESQSQPAELRRKRTQQKQLRR